MQKVFWYIVTFIGAFLMLNIIYVIFSNGPNKLQAMIGVVIGAILAFVGAKKINKLSAVRPKSKKSI